MSPSKTARRAGVVATGTFLLAMAASPAYALGVPPALVQGSPCPPLTQSIPAGLHCIANVLQPNTAQLPAPAPAPSPPATPAPNPLSGAVNNVGKTASQLPGSVGGAVGAVTGGNVGGLGGGIPIAPGSPPGGTTPASTPATTPTTGPSNASGGTGTAAKSPTPSSHVTSAADGSSLLGPAAAFLPGSSIASFADLGSGDLTLAPLADSIPSPLLAGPEASLAAVQAPLIAAGDRASHNADSILARISGKALPGILVVLGTALVAAVGAGNLRAWQARMADKRQAAAAS